MEYESQTLLCLMTTCLEAQQLHFPLLLFLELQSKMNILLFKFHLEEDCRYYAFGKDLSSLSYGAKSIQFSQIRYGQKCFSKLSE